MSGPDLPFNLGWTFGEPARDELKTYEARVGTLMCGPVRWRGACWMLDSGATLTRWPDEWSHKERRPDDAWKPTQPSREARPLNVTWPKTVRRGESKTVRLIVNGGPAVEYVHPAEHEQVKRRVDGWRRRVRGLGRIADVAAIGSTDDELWALMIAYTEQRDLGLSEVERERDEANRLMLTTRAELRVLGDRLVKARGLHKAAVRLGGEVAESFRVASDRLDAKRKQAGGLATEVARLQRDLGRLLLLLGGEQRHAAEAQRERDDYRVWAKGHVGMDLPGDSDEDLRRVLSDRLRLSDGFRRGIEEGRRLEREDREETDDRAHLAAAREGCTDRLNGKKRGDHVYTGDAHARSHAEGWEAADSGVEHRLKGKADDGHYIAQHTSEAFDRGYINTDDRLRNGSLPRTACLWSDLATWTDPARVPTSAFGGWRAAWQACALWYLSLHHGRPVWWSPLRRRTR